MQTIQKLIADTNDQSLISAFYNELGLSYQQAKTDTVALEKSLKTIDANIQNLETALKVDPSNQIASKKLQDLKRQSGEVKVLQRKAVNTLVNVGVAKSKDPVVVKWFAEGQKRAKPSILSPAQSGPLSPMNSNRRRLTLSLISNQHEANYYVQCYKRSKGSAAKSAFGQATIYRRN
jgi:hypothetical protein